MAFALTVARPRVVKVTVQAPPVVSQLQRTPLAPSVYRDTTSGVSLSKCLED